MQHPNNTHDQTGRQRVALTLRPTCNKPYPTIPIRSTPPKPLILLHQDSAKTLIRESVECWMGGNGTRWLAVTINELKQYVNDKFSWVNLTFVRDAERWLVPSVSFGGSPEGDSKMDQRDWELLHKQLKVVSLSVSTRCSFTSSLGLVS